MKRQALLLMLGLVQMGAHAQTPSEWTEADISTERTRIEAVRNETNAKYDAADLACKAKFVVMACENEVRLKRIADLAVLRREEVSLNDIVRQQNAKAQKQRLERRLVERAAADAKVASEPTRPAVDAPAKSPLAPGPTSGGVSPEKASTHMEISPDTQAMNRAAYQKKLLEAQEKKRARDERLEAAPSSVAPLPVPP
ncbi:hypothetical protein [Rhodoferax aquaticus]|uniref:DUF4398 domain-containing protein n=1 Tax=Rhodoferax aquaticus TaxID=2527691 RepID=A0A515EPZ6_9BURK|nr:hypothetical protein [Rhodoferax aquaticus]QDL54742.1 hypothetical protein EXZ61_11485 [Rhodoferax aquaticus]